MAVLLVDIERVRRHLRETTSDEIDMDIGDLIIDAKDIIADYRKVDVSDLPESIMDWQGSDRSAFLLIIGALYKDREADVADILSQAIVDLLNSRRDPAMA